MSAKPSTAPPVQPDPTKMDPRSFDTLLAIMAALRTPVTGCPWDLEQDFPSIAPYTIEEAYEVADAIARGSKDDLREELGDLLLQPVYHAQMASEDGAFDMSDVIEGIVTKMIRRHPHVFGDEAAKAAPLAKGFWEDQKSKERAAKPLRTLDGVAINLPALMRAYKYQAKAAKVGFDWPHVEHVVDKIAEEVAEFKEATPDKRKEEFGDLLFAIVNLGRHYGIDAEDALRGANLKFERRFQFIEDQLKERGKVPKQSDLAEMDALWNSAKKQGL